MLPDILADNRLFRDMIYVADIQDWDDLLDCLRGRPAPSKEATAIRRSVAGLLDDESQRWLSERGPTRLSRPDQVCVISSLNKLLANPALLPPDLTAASVFPCRTERRPVAS